MSLEPRGRPASAPAAARDDRQDRSRRATARRPIRPRSPATPNPRLTDRNAAPPAQQDRLRVPPGARASATARARSSSTTTASRASTSSPTERCSRRSRWARSSTAAASSKLIEFKYESGRRPQRPAGGGDRGRPGDAARSKTAQPADGATAPPADGRRAAAPAVRCPAPTIRARRSRPDPQTRAQRVVVPDPTRVLGLRGDGSRRRDDHAARQGQGRDRRASPRGPRATGTCRRRRTSGRDAVDARRSSGPPTRRRSRRRGR